MTFFILFIMAVQFQSVTVPVSDSVRELGIYISISPDELKSVFIDSVFVSRYEIQVQAYDKPGNQVAGDYWDRVVVLDSIDIQDTVTLVIPMTAVKFNLRIVDLHAYEIFNLTEKIVYIKHLSNIRYFLGSDTLSLFFTVLNKQGEAESLEVFLNNMNIAKKLLRKEKYDDSVTAYVGTVPIASYKMMFNIYGQKKKIGEVMVPVKISRPFYLDDKMWSLKVSQLEYIATSSEMDKLRKSEKVTRDSAWAEFWKQYDPTPSTAVNEKEKEYFERIEYADEHFVFGDKGWRSDRGRIYVKNGAPDEVQSKPYELSTRPYEVWLYYRLNLKFIFVDRYGFGEYLLINQGGERI